MVMQGNQQRKGSTNMKKNTSKTKNTKAPKTSNPASKAASKKNAAKPVTPALSSEKIEQVKAIAASGVRDPEMLEAAINAIAAAPEPAKPEPATKEKSEACDGSKKAVVLALLRRDGGATLGEIAQATDWQLHSIRGFLSGQVAKKMGLKIDSIKDDGGKRRYHIAGQPEPANRRPRGRLFSFFPRLFPCLLRAGK